MAGDVTPDELTEWRSHPVTKAFHSDLKSMIVYDMIRFLDVIPTDDVGLAKLQRAAAERDLLVQLLDWGKSDEDN